MITDLLCQKPFPFNVAFRTLKEKAIEREKNFKGFLWNSCKRNASSNLLVKKNCKKS